MRPLLISIEIGCLTATLGCADSSGLLIRREESALLNYANAAPSRMRILIRCRLRNAPWIVADILPSVLSTDENRIVLTLSDG